MALLYQNYFTPYVGTSAETQAEQLEDLDDIVNEPQPALGAPPGVSTPLLMGSDYAPVSTHRRTPTSEALDLANTYHRRNRTRGSRTISIDLLDELSQVLAVECNQMWDPAWSLPAVCAAPALSSGTTNSAGPPISTIVQKPQPIRELACGC
jgi:hypothetical protein